MLEYFNHVTATAVAAVGSIVPLSWIPGWIPDWLVVVTGVAAIVFAVIQVRSMLAEASEQKLGTVREGPPVVSDEMPPGFGKKVTVPRPSGWDTPMSKRARNVRSR